MFMDYRIFNRFMVTDQCTPEFIEWSQRTVFSHEVCEFYHELRGHCSNPVRLIEIGNRINYLIQLFDLHKEKSDRDNPYGKPLNKNDTDIFTTDDPFFDNAIYRKPTWR